MEVVKNYIIIGLERDNSLYILKHNKQNCICILHSNS